MSTWKVILATLIIFAAGVVTGGLFVKGSSKKAAKPKEVNLVRTEMLRRLTRDLNLNAQQRQKINDILQESNERGKILRDVIEPELRAEYKKAIEDIREQLTPSQRNRFDELLKQQKRKGNPNEKRRQNAATTNLVRGPTNSLGSPSNAPAL